MSRSVEDLEALIHSMHRHFNPSGVDKFDIDAALKEMKQAEREANPLTAKGSITRNVVYKTLIALSTHTVPDFVAAQEIFYALVDADVIKPPGERTVSERLVITPQMINRGWAAFWNVQMENPKDRTALEIALKTIFPNALFPKASFA